MDEGCRVGRMVVTEYIDNLIAEAKWRAAELEHNPRTPFDHMDDVEVFSAIAAALGVVQPVTPGREALAKALLVARHGHELFPTIWRHEVWRDKALNEADALLPLLGQPRTERLADVWDEGANAAEVRIEGSHYAVQVVQPRVNPYRVTPTEETN